MVLIPIPPYFWLWFGIAFVVLVAAYVAANLLFPKRPFQKYRYARKEYLLTQPERDCFNALLRTVGNQYHVFPQIHLASILEHKIRGQNWNGAFRHIDEKSVDFVLCDKERLSPVLAIELDDRTHERSDRQERDREVERILLEANLPLLRLKHEFSEQNLQGVVAQTIKHGISS